jgi:hypothetical protein
MISLRERVFAAFLHLLAKLPLISLFPNGCILIRAWQKALRRYSEHAHATIPLSKNISLSRPTRAQLKTR